MREAEATRMKVVVLLGWPAWSSLSPVVHEAGFRAVGLNWRYLPLDIPPGCLSVARAVLGSPSVAGANVTMPHKEDVLALVDALTPRAKAARAVNTIIKKDGLLTGDNTDGCGLLQALAAKGATPTGRKVVFFGAGGAARGCAAGLVQAGACEIVVLNRSLDRAAALVNSMSAGGAGKLRASVHRWFHEDEDARLLADVMEGAGVVVNATPVTRKPGASPIPVETLGRLRLSRDCVFCDMVYRPAVTGFLQQGQALGLPVVSGLEVLLYQAVPAFEAWTGRCAPVGVMQAALLSAAARDGVPGGDQLGFAQVSDGW